MAIGQLMDGIVNYVIQVFAATFAQVLILLGPGLVLAFLMNVLARHVERRAYRLLGARTYLALFGWLGTTVHELGHAIACLIFRHKITAMKLFEPDPQGGTLGYVNHAYNPDSLYQQIGNFFIGIGPIIFGTFVIYSACRYLLGPEVFVSVQRGTQHVPSIQSFGDVVTLMREILRTGTALIGAMFSLDQLINWRFYIFLYIAFSVGSSITLSPSDIEGALRGFGALIGMLLVFNGATLWIGAFATKWFVAAAKFYSVVYSVMCFALVVNLMAAVILSTASASARTLAPARRQGFRG